MDLVLAVLSGFLLAPVAIGLHRVLRGWAEYVIALLPLGLVVFFLQFLGKIAGTEARTVAYEWIPSLGVSFSLRLDGLALLMSLLISAVGGLVLIYSQGYLKGKPHRGAFSAYILCFMASMLGLVLAGNLLLLYVFWEFTTITSYLLIGFEHEKTSAREAAIKSLIVTSLGGLAMLAGIVLLGQTAGTYEIAELLTRGDAVRADSRYPAVLVLILLGAFAKSAQFPFHFWLPAAMAAPTPVSAYLHSATMVKAGVYLLARLTPVLGGSELWMVLVTSFGAVTMLAGAWLAFFDSDLKGILAYLTVNVLGTLTMLLGIGTDLALKAAMIYLLAHALYKGALFLVAGAVDHEAGTRDIHELRGLRRTMPLTAVLALLSALSMAGVAPFLGYMSKETFLDAVWTAESAAVWLTAAAVFASLLLVAGAGMVGVHPFFGSQTPAAERAHEGGFSLWISPLVLTIGSLAMGILPQMLATPLVGPAASAIRQKSVPVTFQLWHGWNAALTLSLVALFGGIVLFLVRDKVWGAVPARGTVGNWGPDAAYQRTMQALQWGASKQARFLQHGFLRLYVFMTIATLIVLVGLVAPQMDFSFVLLQPLGMRFHEFAASAMILVATFVAVHSRSRFRSITALGVVGLNVAWLFSIFGAPDLAMTQLVMESLIVLLFVLSFFRLPTYTLASERTARIRDAVLSLAAGAIMAVLVMLVSSTQQEASISDYYARHSVSGGHGRNVVNVILVDFRALDTLGEITVLATAAIGVYALTKLVLSQRKTP